VFSTRDRFAANVARLSAAPSHVTIRISRTTVLSALLYLGLTLASSRAAAEVASDSASSASGIARLLQQRRLLDDPYGYRAALEKRGLAVNLFYNHFYAAVIDGGTPSPEEEPHSGSVDIYATADLERALGLRGAELLLQLKTRFHKSENPKIQALSDPVDDADGNSWFYVVQLWYEQGFFDRRLRLRLGYLDEQVTIDRNARKSKSKNTPYHGWTFTGGVAATIVGGRVVYANAGAGWPSGTD
jgi:carbohydrate-selective porin OprB